MSHPITNCRAFTLKYLSTVNCSSTDQLVLTSVNPHNCQTVDSWLSVSSETLQWTAGASVWLTGYYCNYTRYYYVASLLPREAGIKLRRESSFILSENLINHEDPSDNIIKKFLTV